MWKERLSLVGKASGRCRAQCSAATCMTHMIFIAFYDPSNHFNRRNLLLLLKQSLLEEYKYSAAVSTPYNQRQMASLHDPQRSLASLVCTENSPFSSAKCLPMEDGYR